MKKLIVLLLAIAMVAGAYAQVTTKVSLSGSVYLWNQQSAAAASGKVAPNGTGSDVLTLKGAGKDNKFGFDVIDNNLINTAAFNVDLWDVWYDFGTFKVTLGQLNGGSYVQYLNNGWLGNYGPTDNIGNGILFETSALVEGLSIGVFYPSGAKASDNFQKMVVGLSYGTKGLNVCGQVNMDFVTPGTVVNAGFDYTGVKNLDVYGFVDYKTAGAGTFTYGVGGQYKVATWRAGAEFEGSGTNWDVVANLRYYVMPTLFVQVRPEYWSTGRIRVRGYVNYAFGNGFGAEAMVGYDKNPAAGGYTGLIDYFKFTYSISL